MAIGRGKIDGPRVQRAQQIFFFTPAYCVGYLQRRRNLGRMNLLEWLGEERTLVLPAVTSYHVGQQQNHHAYC